MGRNKIPIKKIQDERKRLTTFKKRKDGLLKKAMELSVLCDVEIAIVMFSTANGQSRLHDYANKSVPETLDRLSKFEGPVESKTNATLHKKVDPHFQILHYHPSHDHLTQNAQQASAASRRRKPALGHHFPIYRVPPFPEETLYVGGSGVSRDNDDDDEENDEDEDQVSDGALVRSADEKMKLVDPNVDLQGHFAAYGLSSTTAPLHFLNNRPSESAPALLGYNPQMSGRATFPTTATEGDLGLSSVDVGVGLNTLPYGMQTRLGNPSSSMGARIPSTIHNEMDGEINGESKDGGPSGLQQFSPVTPKQSREMLELEGMSGGVEGLPNSMVHTGHTLLSAGLGLSIPHEHDDEFGRYIGQSRILSAQMKDGRSQSSVAERNSPLISKKRPPTKSKGFIKKSLSIIVPNKSQETSAPHSKSLLTQFKPEIPLPSPTNETPGTAGPGTAVAAAMNGIPLISPKNGIDPLETPRGGPWTNVN